ncbi:MAG: hypothetical protein FJ100_12470 [Deltaproteobacteria bacterium]|nr:hypothetical protein [Deltaproteobacteria bacterium]
MGNARTWTIAVVLLLVIAAVGLVLLARGTQACGDGECGEGESMVSCALDCPGSCGDGFCNPDGENVGTCPADCTPAVPPPPAPTAPPAPPAPTPASAAPTEAPAAAGADRPSEPEAAASRARCGDGTCQAGENGKNCPSDCQPPGRCRDDAFRKIVAQVVKSCADGCKFESKNPVVGISEAQFRALFERAGDKGIGVQFSIFGCNVWKPDGKDCWGYDAHYAEPATCPPDANYACASRSDGGLCNPAGAQTACKKYAAAIEDSVVGFVKQWRQAKYLLLLGTASRTGNDDRGSGGMSQANKDLALVRAANVEGLVDRLRGEMEQFKEPVMFKSYKVVLDNTKQFFDSAGFKKLVAAQMKVGKDGGFKPTTDNAINRSVMMIAVGCDLTGEDVGEK